MCQICDDNEVRLAKRRARYADGRRELIEKGVLPERKVGRPRLRPPEEALAVAKQQKIESARRTRELIKIGLARLAEQQPRAPSAADPVP